jgi:hypothetical protein
MKSNKYIMSNVVRSRLINRGDKPECIICGINIKKGDSYVPSKHGNHGYKLYCIDHAKEKNII